MSKTENNIQGELARQPLTETIGRIYSERRTGELTLQAKKTEYKIYFLKGIPVNAQSPLSSDHLLEFMVSLGQLDRDDVPRLRDMIKGGMETDHALLQMGIIDSDKLYHLKQLLVREILIRAGGLQEGKYQFQARENFIDRIPLYDLSPMDIIYEAITRHHLSALPAKMQKMAKTRVRLNPAISELQSLPEIFYQRTYLLDDFKNEMTVERAISFLINEFHDIAQAMIFLYVMMITGVLLVREEQPAPETPRERKPAKPARGVERVREAPVREPKKDTAGTDYIYVHRKKSRRPKATAPRPEPGAKAGPTPGPASPEQMQPEPGSPGLEKSRKLELLESKIRSTSDYFQILGIKPDAPVSEVENVYHQILGQFELEEMIKGDDPELSRRASEVKETIRKIINTLGNPEDRNQYEMSVYRDELKRAWNLDFKKALARKQFERGKWYLEHNRPDFSLERFEQAVELDPEVADHYAYYGWALCRSGKGTAAEIDGYLKQAVRQNPRADTAYYFLGLIAKREQAENLAEEYLRKAITVNPNNAGARRELDSIEKHRKQGLFGKLFKR